MGSMTGCAARARRQPSAGLGGAATEIVAGRQPTWTRARCARTAASRSNGFVAWSDAAPISRGWFRW